MEQRTNEI